MQVNQQTKGKTLVVDGMDYLNQLSENDIQKLLRKIERLTSNKSKSKRKLRGEGG